MFYPFLFQFTHSILRILIGCCFVGLYPLIGWKLKGEEIVYIAEGLASDTGASLEWLKALGKNEEIDRPDLYTFLVHIIYI